MGKGLAVFNLSLASLNTLQNVEMVLDILEGRFLGSIPR